ncbi:type VI secretion system protein TssA [Acinetobacter johnsonii]|uniref:Type VI secretion system protein TssA n=1 Tax=Acinetobacter johnsonii TaxID=40214 RepID=A0AAJ6LCR9_ACIJO|nr:type VI secretion system protein TssA [Acinetobacter johnsonii]ALV72920.1 type VI secretion protein [Acinetobacter johnsonii XBB1]MDH1533406.1 type VI secretion system protein TssA [Acinetobacter johnsonii]WMG17809.1 type VI secretion system protein TssA [Acinetobacter johnsonii]
MSLEIEPLLSPISSDQPCGQDLSFSNEFHAIKIAKTQDDPLLDQGDWVAEPKQADWHFVEQKSIEIFTGKSKDLRLLGWLLEAWSNLYGFEGTAKALELIHRTLNEYWTQLHPEIEDEDLDQRLGLLQSSINHLIPLIKQVAIVNVPAFSLSDYEALLRQKNHLLKQVESYTDDANSSQILEQFEQSLFNTSKSFQYQNYQHFSAILAEWSILKSVLDTLMGLDAPSFAAIDTQLENIHTSLKKLYKTDVFTQPVMATQTSESSAAATITTQALSFTQHKEQEIDMNTVHPSKGFQVQPQNHLANREQAMRVLQEISDYFQANEPHSPVSYMLQKTIKWSQMPLHEWLNQVIKNENPLHNVQELLGVQQANESNDW